MTERGTLKKALNWLPPANSYFAWAIVTGSIPLPPSPPTCPGLMESST